MKRMRRLRPTSEGRRSRDGSSAVEFAMVALPFFFMLFAIMEIGLIFLMDSILDNAVVETGRLVRTGQAKNSSLTEAQFKTALCAKMTIFNADCSNRAHVDVREITQFRNASPPDPLANGTTFDNAGLVYVNGQPGSLMLIRVWYSQPLVTPFMAQALSRLKDSGVTMLTATTTFRNEPF